MIVVLDTNIVVSAMLTPQGPPARVFFMALQNQYIQLCVSAEVFAEYEEVLNRPKFNFTVDAIEAALGSFRERGFWVKPTGKVSICDDPDDDIFLECAEAAAADYLVTGNRGHFPGEGWGRLKIVTAREFITLFEFDRDSATELRLPDDLPGG
jgi:putative PIN family toxin of toxin-antitoxin system